jgi:hypothetical protein
VTTDAVDDVAHGEGEDQREPGGQQPQQQLGEPARCDAPQFEQERHRQDR